MDEKKRTKCVLKQSTAVGPIKGIVQANYIFFLALTSVVLRHRKQELSTWLSLRFMPPPNTMEVNGISFVVLKIQQQLVFPETSFSCFYRDLCLCCGLSVGRSCKCHFQHYDRHKLPLTPIVLQWRQKSQTRISKAGQIKSQPSSTKWKIMFF